MNSRDAEKGGQVGKPGDEDSPDVGMVDDGLSTIENSPKGYPPRSSPQPVVLRVELATRWQAQLAQWAAWVLMLIIVGLAVVVLCVLRPRVSSSPDDPRSSTYYAVVLGIASATLLVLLVIAGVAAHRLLCISRQSLVWECRQLALVHHGTVLLVLEIVISAIWVASNAAVVASSCLWPIKAVAVMAALRQSLVVTVVMWILIVISSMELYRPHASCMGRHFPFAAKPNGTEEPKGNAQRHDGTQAAAERGPAASAIAGMKEEAETAIAAAGASTLAEGRLLVIDQPWAMLLRIHAFKIAIWALLIAITVFEGAMEKVRTEGSLAMSVACALEEGHPPPPPTCTIQTGQRVGDIIFGVILGYLLVSYLLCLWRALRDHANLPYQKYRMTNIFLRVQARYTTVTFAAMLTAWVLESIMVARGSCWSRLESQLGSMPMQLSLFTMVLASVLLYMPAGGAGTRVLQAWLQEFTWTEASLPQALARRNERLQQHLSGSGFRQTFLRRLRSMATLRVRGVGRAVGATGTVGATLDAPGTATGATLDAAASATAGTSKCITAAAGSTGAARAGWTGAEAGRAPEPLQQLYGLSSVEVPGWRLAAHDVAAQLASEPMLCMEAALRLLFWARLAYAVAEPPGPITEQAALALYGLQHSEVLREPASESLAVVGWGGPGSSRVLVAFRGTDNLQNVITDMKIWKTPHLPKRRRHGMLVLVHAGFYSAWRLGGFGERVVGKLREVVDRLQVEPSQLALHITGHSLGGALATLAAFDIRRAFPSAGMRVYTFGAPRVGNLAWAREYNAAVPDTFMFINREDPVPRIPKFLFKRCGKRVTINPAGDIIVRPSYFELSVLTRSGGTVKDHLTGTYALSLARALKSQFLETKRLPGGEEGVVGLAGCMDLGQALVMGNMDLRSLKDPCIQPVPLELLQKQRKLKDVHASASRLCPFCSCGSKGTVEAIEGQAEMIAPADAAEDLRNGLDGTILLSNGHGSAGVGSSLIRET